MEMFVLTSDILMWIFFRKNKPVDIDDLENKILNIVLKRPNYVDNKTSNDKRDLESNQKYRFHVIHTIIWLNLEFRRNSNRNCFLVE